jgi:polyhydroxyalkanoate synthesis regulator phasin
MEIKSLRYSSRNGISVELFEPGSLRLTVEEACAILLGMKSTLDQKELDENFTQDEQNIISKYEQLNLAKMSRLSDKYRENISVRKIHQELKEILKWYFECVRAGWVNLATDFLGWNLVEPKAESIIDRLVKKGLKEGRTDKAYFEHLLKYKEWGEASPEVIQRLEEAIGPLNLESI